MSILNPGGDGGEPGPTLTELVEFVPMLVNDDPVVVAERLRERYGDVVAVPPLHPALDSDVYLLSNPEDIQYVLQSHPSSFRALDVPGSRDFSRVVRNSIVSLHSDSEEGSWTQRLRLVGTEFGEEAAQEHVPELAETTLATLGEFADGLPGQVSAGDPSSVPDGARVWTPESDGVRLLPAMRRLTLRLLGVSLFGRDMRAHEAEVIQAVHTLRSLFKRRQLHLVTSYVTRQLPDRVPLPGWVHRPLGVNPHIRLTGRHERRTTEAVETLQAAASDVVARRERTPLVFDDALGEWLRRRDPVTGERIPPAALRQEVMGLLIAGHATMSAGLTWACYLLAARPEAQERIHEEARATTLLSGPEAIGEEGPERADACHPVEGAAFLESVPYTKRVWKETLRLYPSLPVFGRTVDESVEFDGIDIEAGSHVLTSPYVVHRDERWWDDPETFDPSRFEGDNGRPPFAYFPFSGGRHACLGEAIATTEATTVLATMLATHRIEFAGPDVEDPHAAPEVGVDSAINLQPDRDIVVRFVPRETEADGE
ncbi:cytochrome P450 [Natronomonas halophila]|uniref:cytochrome P450 n=1 Tax=Natronomonas halophila TaxID=2747817 RepID=UPI0015B78BA0|nr:cytochrome P450 [Natronomonas halophila]QLD85090.1 cytochrome P450 [Natronomonas halophila]